MAQLRIEHIFVRWHVTPEKADQEEFECRIVETEENSVRRPGGGRRLEHHTIQACG